MGMSGAEWECRGPKWGCRGPNGDVAGRMGMAAARGIRTLLLCPGYRIDALRHSQSAVLNPIRQSSSHSSVVIPFVSRHPVRHSSFPFGNLQPHSAIFNLIRQSAFESSALGTRQSSIPILVVVRRCRVELPAVFVASGDFVGGLELLVVVVLHAERFADVVDAILIGRRVVAAGGLVAD
jgi:hypothetical protein